jgi:DNA polymerase sigma
MQLELKPIVLFLKKLLQNNNLNQPYHGGLNSYSLILMTSAFLSKFSQVQSVSKNLVELLRYFGYFFDPEIIIVDNQDFIPQVCSLVDPMTVIDPLNKINNTTRSAFRIKEI